MLPPFWANMVPKCFEVLAMGASFRLWPLRVRMCVGLRPKTLYSIIISTQHPQPSSARGAPIIDFMNGLAGWRSVFIWLTLPVALFSLILVVLVFPFKPPEVQFKPQKDHFMVGFKKVLGNKSAFASARRLFHL